MAKKKNVNQQAFLSPEKYIKERGRSLEIHECWISKSWEQDKLAEIVIARKHNNGNITSCVYLVDLLCFGVKDSLFNHNQAQWQYDEMIASFNKDLKAEKVDYTLVHNVIYAAVEFAADYKLRPSKDYLQVTQYFLEEDSDDVPLIEVVCGINDEPTIIVGPENGLEARRTIAHFEKEFGKGVLKIEYAEDELANDPFGASEEDETPHVPYLPLVESLTYSNEEHRIRDIEVVKEGLKQNDAKEMPENFVEVVDAVDRLFYNKVGFGRVKALFSDFGKAFSVKVGDDLPDELLAFGSALPATKEENAKILHDYYYYHKTEIEEWITKWPEFNHIPMVSVELIVIQLFANKVNEFDQYIDFLVEKSPDYYLTPFLASIKGGDYINSTYLQKLDEGESLNDVFNSNREVQITEFLLICYAYYQYLTEKNVPERIVVFWNYLWEAHQLQKTEYIEVFNLMAKNMYVNDHVIAKL